MPPVEAGQVWWCDGAELAFESYFKRRPVLILAVNSLDESAVVAPLSSKRRFGQEQAVTHEGGISYLTGSVQVVINSALVRPLGRWTGFEEWRAQIHESHETGPGSSFWARVRARFRRKSL